MREQITEDVFLFLQTALPPLAAESYETVFDDGHVKVTRAPAGPFGRMQVRIDVLAQ